MMNDAPIIVNATTVKKGSFLTDRHTSVLLKDIESLGSVEYRFILAVFGDQARQPCPISDLRGQHNGQETRGWLILTLSIFRRCL